MNRTFALLLVCCALAVSGCATTGGGGVGTNPVEAALCAHPLESRLALDVAYAETSRITDPIAQLAAQLAINTSRAALAACPSTGS